MRRPLVTLLVLATLAAAFVACGGDTDPLVESSTGPDLGRADLSGVAVVPVSFDIKPASCPNPFNPKSRGVLPVAIVGSTDFDVNDIDVSSILLEGAIVPLRSRIQDVATAVVPEPQLPNIEVVSFLAPRIAYLGDVVGGSIRLAIRNSGSADAVGLFPVGFYISDDAVITTSDRLLIGGREHVNGLLTGQQKVLQLWAGASVPNDAPLGSVFIGAIADEFDTIAESDETDNTAASPITILEPGNAPAAYDLIVEGEDCACTTEGPDGIDDLTMKFRTEEVVAVLGALAPGEIRELTITGQLLDGTPFEGTDCIIVVGGSSGHEDDPGRMQ
jgi:hypothetical protein